LAAVRSSNLWSARRQCRLAAGAARANLEDACNVGKPTDDAATVKRAYRKLMNEHHPDKLAKGLPPEMMEMAKQKLRRSRRPGS
jgi:DnaJ-domain-containing protein 1